MWSASTEGAASRRRRHYQDLLADDLEELLHDPDSEEEWIEATLNLLFLVQEIIEELEPPQ